MYKDVIHEDSLEIEGENKAPDYAFRIGGTRKFFVEAKKPAVNIEMNIHPAFQLRRYAWSAKLPLGILTDFEEFAIYDCRVKPDKTDKASTGRAKLLSYKDYIEKWDEIAAVFSREAVLKGSFDEYAEGIKGRKGTTEVDDAFLAEIERWRELLAKNLALRNPNLTARELNYAVQMTIDRIVFLRICEDRGIERDKQLKNISEEKNVYENLIQLFQSADTRYNSGLFHFKNEREQSSGPDSLTFNLKIDDRVLHDILRNLYYPESPYVFREIPSDILGQVYERFLGKVIRLTDGHQAKIEEKPEVRKAGGVYYTPTSIVDYIVQNTVGKLLEGKTPKDAAKLKILDPACGSGTFPLGAYEYLLEWHLKWYIENELEKSLTGKKPVMYQSKDGYQLTTAKKKEILLNNIFGVDIDPQAVEVTKLSLLLKVLEGESQETIGSQLLLLQERVLPDLGKNIQCGNSLIEPDYFEAQQLTMAFADVEERYRVNAFDWKGAFPHVFIHGGFDVVIGNPPWGAEFKQEDEKYVRRSYDVAKTSAIDSYAIFIERSIKTLREGGLIGFITPDTFLRKRELLPTRLHLLNQTEIVELIETGPVFSQVRDTWCLIFVAAKKHASVRSQVRHRKISRFITSAEDRLSQLANRNWSGESMVSQGVWLKKPESIIAYLASEEAQRIIDKMETHPSLAEQQDKYKISRGEEGSKFALTPDTSGNYFMVIPKDIERYSFAAGLQVNENTLTPTKVRSLYGHPKIWIIRIQKMRWKQRIVSVFDERTNSAGMKTLQIIVSPTDDTNALKYLSGILSSRLMNFWCINYLADDMNQVYLSRIPIPHINFSNSAEKIQHDKLISMVDRMLELYRRSTRTPQEQEIIKREIASTDRQIDSLVYGLYGLSNDEINIVEDNS
jgi:type I restriction-modification system DNA methylase subunit